MAYGLTFRPAAIITFGIMVAALNQTLVALMYSYTPRMFPTELRATGTGFCYGMGRALSAVGPLLIGQIYPTTGYVAVFVFIGACCLMITVSVLLLVHGQQARWVPDAADQDPVQPSPGVRPLETG